MKRLFVLLCGMLLVIWTVTTALAVPVTFTYTSDNVVATWFKDGAAPSEISTGTTAGHDDWRVATTNTIDLDSSHQWELIWLNVNSDHDAGWKDPSASNPGGFLGQVVASDGLILPGGSVATKILTGSLYWEVARIDNFFILENGWGDTNKTIPTLSELQSIYNERPTAAQWAGLTWVNATQYGVNGTSPWSVVSDIDATAQWIWTTENFGTPGAPDINDAVFVRVKFTPVPEPATMLLLGTGLIGLAAFAKKKRRRG